MTGLLLEMIATKWSSRWESFVRKGQETSGPCPQRPPSPLRERQLNKQTAFDAVSMINP